jgi:SHS2 domain-containing protein
MSDKISKKWEHFPHEADIGVRGFGTTMAEAFEMAAVALSAVITEPEKIEPQRKVPITCDGDDDESLLVNWLSSLIYEMDSRKMLFGRFEIEIEKNHLTAAAWGEKIDVQKHQPTVEVKACTYTELSVRKNPDGNWLAQCVVDV